MIKLFGPLVSILGLIIVYVETEVSRVYPIAGIGFILLGILITVKERMANRQAKSYTETIIDSQNERKNMSRDIRGPSQEEMGLSAGKQFENPQNKAFVERTLAMAEQLKGNKLRPELVEAIDEAFSLGDPDVIEALHPDSPRSQKYLSEQQRENLKGAWEVYERGKQNPS